MTKTASSEPTLTSREDDLLAKVKEHVSKNNSSYALEGKDEHVAAKRLVGQGRLFYSLDYDHVRAMGNG